MLRRGEAASEVEGLLSDEGLEYKRLVLYDRDVIVAWGPSEDKAAEKLRGHPAVELVSNVGSKLQLSSREWLGGDSVARIGNVEVGRDFIVIAGPCGIESREQVEEAVSAVWSAGAHVVRGGAWKPRTSPYSFQGIGLEAAKWLAEAAHSKGLPAITEVMDPRDARQVFNIVDGVWVGARSMQVTPLLRELGRLCRETGKAVLIKRGFGNTLEEWLLASEYVMLEGCSNVALIERGSRCWASVSRFSLDVAIIPVARGKTHLPIIVDPSHPAGKRELVEPLALAATAAGAQGLMIEVHPWPEKALSDKQQQLTPGEFKRLMEKLKLLLEALGRRMAPQPKA
ncbi:3-deoxy-7-phosphoheptulonate synthase [Pyrolobus fumarii]|uniref:3-deoxy-7-phosphoheptulonate synthase n=1 Tax=Pyrolobus fumarii TaxID=54252 RepID=UPI00068E9A20|nr:3-deoxy-7-phosphoheptulonate synthase [Pyrolobus fumarii]